MTIVDVSRDTQGFYDGKFVGFGFAEVVKPDASLENDYFTTTLGWGVWNNTQVICINALSPNPTVPSWNLTNAATGTPSCGGTLTAAQYTQSYAYGDANHLDAVTTAPSYSANYDTAGSMTARNGQALSYDILRRLTHWQNTASSPTSTADYAYNGTSERVQQKTATTSNGVTTTITTNYIGAFEEVASSVQTGACSPCATSTATTKYYQAGPVTEEMQGGNLY